jgi:hypothetical protein
MTRYNFLAPITGKVNATDTYCGTSTPHQKCNSPDINPKDLDGGVGGQNIQGYGFGGGSIGVRTYANGCCSTCSGDPHNARYVDFYRFQNGSTPIGTVLFGHVASPKADGVYNSNSIKVGTVPTQGSCGNPPCWTGPHSHFERVPGGNATTPGVGCGTTPVQGSTVIYYWDF